MVAFGGLKALFDNSTKEELISTNSPGDYSPGKLTENKPDIIQSLSLKGITRINGNAVYFFFTKDGFPFDPSIDGYAYISRGDCGATLIRNDEIHHIDCSFDENIQEGDASRRVASST